MTELKFNSEEERKQFEETEKKIRVGVWQIRDCLNNDQREYLVEKFLSEVKENPKPPIISRLKVYYSEKLFTLINGEYVRNESFSVNDIPEIVREQVLEYARNNKKYNFTE